MSLTPTQEEELRGITSTGQLCCFGAAALNAIILAFNITSPVCWTITGMCWLGEREVYTFLRNMKVSARLSTKNKSADQIRQELSQGTLLMSYILDLFPDARFVGKND